MPPQAPPRWTSVRARLSVSLVLVVCLVASLTALGAGAATQQWRAPITAFNPAPQDTGIAPRYQSYTPPKGAPFGTDAGEPSIGVNHKTGKVLFQSYVDTLSVGFDDCTSPARTVWESNVAPNAATSLDPILITNPTIFKRADNTEFCRTFVSQLAGKASLSAYTDDDGETFTVSQGNSPLLSGVDHQTYGSGPYRPGTSPQLPGQAFTHAVYYCSQDIGYFNCTRSDDGGLTFGPAIIANDITRCGVGSGLHGHVQVAPDGTVYVPFKFCNGKQATSVSVDNGLTWTIRVIPDSTAGQNDPAIGIDADGTVYFGYQDGSGRPKVAVSNDRGATWAPSVDIGVVNDGTQVFNSVFPTTIGGEDGRAVVAFLGTATEGNYQDNDEPGDATDTFFNGVWFAFVAHTYDGGQSWVTVNATPGDPVQRGSICRSGTTCDNTPNDRNLLDFIDVAVDPQGRVHVGIADGCTGPCITANPDLSPIVTNSFSALATIVRQSGGRGLVAQAGEGDIKAPGTPLVTAAKEGTAVRLSWPEPDNGGSPITGYNIYRGTVEGGPTQFYATTTERSFTDTAVDPNTTYYYQVTAVNAIGESVKCAVVSPVVLGNPCVEPGITVLTDPEGDLSVVDTGNSPNRDIRSISVAEPFFEDNSQKLIITLKIQDFSGVNDPSTSLGTTWRVYFNGANSMPYFVDMTNNAGTLTFNYGTGTGTRVGDLPGSEFKPDGTIRFVVPTDKIGTPVAGTSISGIYSRVIVVAGVVDNANFPSPSADILYTLVGNAFCKPGVTLVTPRAALRTEPSPAAGNAPLTVSFFADQSEAFNGATITSYTFDFGDGQSVTQASPTVQHSYAQPGGYRAVLRVTDSNGQVSLNIADAFVTVAEQPQVEPTTTTTGSPTSTPIVIIDPPPTQPPVEQTPGTTATTGATATGPTATSGPATQKLYLPLIRR